MNTIKLTKVLKRYLEILMEQEDWERASTLSRIYYNRYGRGSRGLAAKYLIKLTILNLSERDSKTKMFKAKQCKNDQI